VEWLILGGFIILGLVCILLLYVLVGVVFRFIGKVLKGRFK